MMQPRSISSAANRQLTVSVFDQVNALCSEFADHWQSPPRPDLRAYVDQVADHSQQMLFRNLLLHELKMRRREGEQPTTDEYQRKFPEFASVVRGVFVEATSTGIGLDTEATQTVDFMPAASRLGDYRLGRELGRGGMGAVFEARHVRHENRVALKTLPQVDGARLHKFKREFRSLADMNHPNLVSLYTLESDGVQWFFTMELIDGVDLLSYVRPSGRLDEIRLRAALMQLVTGVMALHSHHIIHRDLKPSNVMVTRNGQVKLLDFGLVLELDRTAVSVTEDHVMGTPRYMAPEQAAGERVTAASDWYAVGTMWYEALAGQPPFQGSLTKLLQDKQTTDPPPLEDPSLPQDLVQLSMRLLSRDPDQRPDPLEVAQAVSTDQAVQAPTAKSRSDQLVGRDRQLAVLRESFDALRQQQASSTVFISGRSGEGKTSLAEHFLDSLRDDPDVTALSGRCYDRESVPFKALDSLIDALASYLRGLPESKIGLLLPRDIAVLAHVFPVLQRVPLVAEVPRARMQNLDQQQVRTRAFYALRELLLQIGDRTPVVMFIDDLQWGDADSAQVMFEVLRPPEAPVVLFMGSFRSDEIGDSAFLQEWEKLPRRHGVELPRHEVKVGPLSVEECTQLVIGLTGKDSEAVRKRARQFTEETGGNPYLLTELIGCFDAETDSFQRLPMEEVVAQKLQRLPHGAAALLDVISVSGQALAVDEAARASGNDGGAISTVTQMRSERLVRLIGSEDNPVVDTYHDRIRETVLTEMTAQQRQLTHLALAREIEDQAADAAQWVECLEAPTAEMPESADVHPRVYDLAYHFDAAGQKRKGWIYGLLAAEQAKRQYALEVAAEQYAIADRNLQQPSAALRYRIAAGWGHALMLLGRYDQAAVQFDAAFAATEEDIEKKARIEAFQGELAFKQGRIDDSIATHERALRRLGVWVPRSWLGLACGVLRETFIQSLHTLMPRMLHRKTLTRRKELIIYLFNRAMTPYIFQNTITMMWGHLSGMNRVEVLPRSKQLTFSYAYHACAMSMLGWKTRGNTYGELAMELAHEFDDRFGVGQSCNYPGIGCYAAARYEEGLSHLADAIEAFESSGDIWELHVARFHLGCCHLGLGALDKAIVEARRTFVSSARLGDSRTLCSSFLWARATGGNFPFEELKACFPCRPDDVMSTVHGIMAEGHWHAFHGRTQEALGVFEQAAEMVKRTLCVNSHTILVVPNLAGALRAHASRLHLS